MMNEVDGMKQEDYSKDWMMHNGMSDQLAWHHSENVVQCFDEQQVM